MDTAWDFKTHGETRSETQAVAFTAAPPEPMLSIIVPTRNEAGNIRPLLARIERATQGIPTQVVFVDDSTDETAAVIKESGSHYSMQTTCIVRSPEQRSDGLGGAVLAGFRVAQAPWVCVMDADLQHPPELIPELLDQARNKNADMVIASRRSKDSNAKSLGALRTFISRTLDLCARFMFPAHLRGIADPLTGFFLARRDAISPEKLKPRGFKILLEILVRFPTLRVTEVPFDFGMRQAGKSKASPQEVWRYVSMLWNLRFGDNTGQLFRFVAVGVTGLVVNSLALAIVTDWMGIYYMISAAFATVASTTWNFALTESWVFGERRNKSGLVKRFALFFLMNNIALLLRSPIMYSLTDWLGVNYLISNLVSLGVLMLLRYFLADAWIWGGQVTKNISSEAPAVAFATLHDAQPKP